MGGAIKGRGWWVEQSEHCIEGVGQWEGDGGWSNQSSDAHVCL